jgi:hypothetical protein
MPVDINVPQVRVDPEKGVTVSGQLEGMPIDLTIGRDGVDLRQREERQPRP